MHPSNPDGARDRKPVRGLDRIFGFGLGGMESTTLTNSAQESTITFYCLNALYFQKLGTVLHNHWHWVNSDSTTWHSPPYSPNSSLNSPPNSPPNSHPDSPPNSPPKSPPKSPPNSPPNISSISPSNVPSNTHSANLLNSHSASIMLL